jgi:hypothetical protein
MVRRNSDCIGRGPSPRPSCGGRGNGAAEFGLHWKGTLTPALSPVGEGVSFAAQRNSRAREQYSDTSAPNPLFISPGQTPIIEPGGIFGGTDCIDHSIVMG